MKINTKAACASLFALTSIPTYAQLSQAWAQPYNGGGIDEAYSCACDKRGNTYVVGRSASTSNGYDIVTVKYNPLGAEVWVKRWDNIDVHGDDSPVAPPDVARAIAVDNDGSA